MKKIKIILAAAIAAMVVAAIFTAAILTAGGSADVVATYAERSLKSVYALCAEAGYAEGDEREFTLSADGQAQFFRSDERTGIRVSLAPFLAAGLDVKLLPEDYLVEGEELVFSAAYSRTILGYHSAMGHFNYTFGGGAFEWAQNPEENDMDVVFALDPEPLIAAGVRSEEVVGWTYAPVETHVGGKTVEVDRFLKSFDLA